MNPLENIRGIFSDIELEAFFRFIRTPHVKPTNNLGEQGIRFVVIDRYVTQGTGSEKGRVWCEPIQTIMAARGSQGQSGAVVLNGLKSLLPPDLTVADYSLSPPVASKYICLHTLLMT